MYFSLVHPELTHRANLLSGAEALQPGLQMPVDPFGKAPASRGSNQSIDVRQYQLMLGGTASSLKFDYFLGLVRQTTLLRMLHSSTTSATDYQQ